MCGGCSREEARDWLSPAVPTRAHREVAARTVSDMVTATRLAVRAEASGFSVRRPTGRVTLAPTLTQVWAELVAVDGRLQLDEPAARAATPHPLPHTPATRLALLLTRDPERTARAWTADRLVDLASESLDTVLKRETHARVLAWADPEAGDSALTLVTAPDVRLRATLVAVVRDGRGPAWADELAGLGTAGLASVLAGRTLGSLHRPRPSAPVAAAWVGGLVATGRAAGRRLTVHVAGDRVTIDAAHGTGLAVRVTV